MLFGADGGAARCWGARATLTRAIPAARRGLPPLHTAHGRRLLPRAWLGTPLLDQRLAPPPGPRDANMAVNAIAALALVAGGGNGAVTLW